MGQQILGRKQKISNDAWLEAMKQIEDLVSKSELDARVGQTVKDIMATIPAESTVIRLPAVLYADMPQTVP